MFNAIQEAESIRDLVIEYRRKLHEIPEVCFDLKETVKVLETYLDDMNIPSERCGKCGLTAIIEANDADGPVIALRADMDGLPLQEETGLPFASRTPGKMHACGHDAHMAIALGTARLLCANRDKWKGKVKLIFQPAEEYVSGAKDMISAGVLKNQKIDMVIGAHVWKDVPIGRIGIKPGAFMASSGNFTITISGQGGHGALPHQGQDSIMAAAAFISDIQSVLSRSLPSSEPYVLSFGSIHGGVKNNSLAESVKLEGTFRTFSHKTCEVVENKIKTCLESQSMTYGTKWDYDLWAICPPTINDANLEKRLAETISGLIGEKNVVSFGPVMGGDDFSEFGKYVPSVYFFIGCGSERTPYPHHHSKFILEEDCIPLGTALMTQIIIDISSR